MNHRSVAPAAASALTVSATGLNDSGCSLAAIVHPPIRHTGDAIDEATPHHCTLLVITMVRTVTKVGEDHDADRQWAREDPAWWPAPREWRQNG